METAEEDGPGQAHDNDEDDDSIYMQLPPQWLQLLAELQGKLDAQTKEDQRKNAYFLQQWLAHRCVDTAMGYWLGHCSGPVGELAALLAAYVGADETPLEHEGAREQAWAVGWAEKLMPYLPLHPGSRQAGGLPPVVQPVMLFSRELPVDLESSDIPDPDAPTLPLGNYAAPSTGVRAPPAETPSRPGKASEVQKTEAAYLDTLQAPATGPKRQRTLTVEMSTGSGDAPRVSRSMVVPLTDGAVEFSFRVTVDAVASHDASTQPFEPPEHGATQLDMNSMHEGAYVEAYRRWLECDLTDAAVLAMYGREVLAMFQAQYVMAMSGVGGTEADECPGEWE